MINQLDKEFARLKDLVSDMLDLVKIQVERAEEAMFDFNESLLIEAQSTEKTINNLDLKIDNRCENILALHQPVAVDLRFVMACLSINTFLERVGDNAFAIVRIGEKTQNEFDAELLKSWRLKEMFKVAKDMIDAVKEGFEEDNTLMVANSFKLDQALDDINAHAEGFLSDYATQNPTKIKATFTIFPVFRKLERIGDMITNISEELIFYIDAKVLKHKSSKKKQKFIDKVEQAD
ncbi:phosphate signaling complex protein PhoU [Cyclobacteriaceae bacterium]|nr:phosphate signaling complex protein PhoU [Cyclobacteriaceae bacterium]